MPYRDEKGLLTDPYQLWPDRVAWFGEFAGARHFVEYGPNLKHIAEAHTRRVPGLYEDADSEIPNPPKGSTPRAVWQHVARLENLPERVPYRVTSVTESGETFTSGTFTVAPPPAPGQPARYLLTSDHQLKPNVAANLQKVVETVGRVDGVLFAGDAANVAGRASEWFDHPRGFFPCLQGRAQSEVSSTIYRGGPILQHAPIFAAPGNHDMMGRHNDGLPVAERRDNAQPRDVAKRRYAAYADFFNPAGDPAVKARWIEDNTWNWRVYDAIFGAPGRFYHIELGDLYLIVLNVTRIWRPYSPAGDQRGKYAERIEDLHKPDNWGWGDFILEDIAAGSAQHTWLKGQLESEAFKRAKYKIVMMHHPVHGLGGNSIPAFAHPIQSIDRGTDGRVTAIRYEYPLEEDIFVRDVEPLLEAAGVQMIYTGHAHVWGHLRTAAGLHYLESSNVGNGYGCYLEGYAERHSGPYGDNRFNPANYPKTGDPHGLDPIPPSIRAPMHYPDGRPLPAVGSSDLTVFSILEAGTVSSYYFDVTAPDSDVIKFDTFTIA